MQVVLKIECFWVFFFKIMRDLHSKNEAVWPDSPITLQEWEGKWQEGWVDHKHESPQKTITDGSLYLVTISVQGLYMKILKEKSYQNSSKILGNSTVYLEGKGLVRPVMKSRFTNKGEREPSTSFMLERSVFYPLPHGPWEEAQPTARDLIGSL
jgi:hypothetical protein